MRCFYILLVKIKKIKFKLFILKYNGVISFLVLKLYKSMYYTCFCVHYFKSYGEIDNILETWRPFWI